MNSTWKLIIGYNFNGNVLKTKVVIQICFPNIMKGSFHNGQFGPDIMDMCNICVGFRKLSGFFMVYLRMSGVKYIHKGKWSVKSCCFETNDEINLLMDTQQLHLHVKLLGEVLLVTRFEWSYHSSLP